jgi:hypothetical protein
MSYSVSATGYLERARAALLSKEPNFLFYAALELRCCVEARQLEYAESHSALKNTTIKSWKIADTGKRIEKVSNVDSISQMRFRFEDQEAVVFHTPVSKQLIRLADKGLGDLLHAQRCFRSEGNEWWAIKQAELVKCYRMSWVACKGDLMVPPLMSKKTGETHPLVINQNSENEQLCKFMAETHDRRFEVEVTYLNEPPATWECDV